MREKPQYYLPGDDKFWSGRSTEASLGIQYWHQAIESIDLFSIDHDKLHNSVGLLGYACDEGVKRNQGRPGAALGPDAIRTRLSKVAWHQDYKVVDVGNLTCTRGNLEKSQKDLSACVYTLLEKNAFPILLGGGHDIAYGHFQGIRTYLSDPESSIGIINFDAHFDLRKVVEQANSGTPFFQILTDTNSNAAYLPIGIQKASNTVELFKTANDHGVAYILLDDCFQKEKEVYQKVESFISQHAKIYVSIDLDGFAAAYAPGVSAPAPIGLEPIFVLHLLQQILKSGKVISLDIAEMNPKYDRDNLTANLAARIVDYTLYHLP